MRFSSLQTFESNSESDTSKLGQAIGQFLEPGTVIGLNGTLGAGKTRLTQAIGIGLGIPVGNVVSPTFTICVPHEARLLLVHLDAYRIKSPEEVDELGLDELAEDGAVLIIEWAERIVKYLPDLDLEISIQANSEDVRTFTLLANSELGQNLVADVMAMINEQAD